MKDKIIILDWLYNVNTKSWENNLNVNIVNQEDVRVTIDKYIGSTEYRENEYLEVYYNGEHFIGFFVDDMYREIKGEY